MLSLITSANIACGFHAGDPTTLRQACRQAVELGVVIGAQVGYPDLAGFGRRFLDMTAVDLTAAVIYQIGALDGLAHSVGGQVRSVKPHGALYNAVVDHQEQAAAVVEAVLASDRTLPVLGLPGSVLIPPADGRLVDRREPDALITDSAMAARRAVEAAGDGRADSFCTHGDSPSAVAMATAVREAVSAAGISIAPFVDTR